MATVEYTALALVVSAVLAVGGAGLDARAVPDAVGAQMRRAMCLVASGDCLGRDGPRPCVTASRTRERLAHATLVFLRLRDGRTVVREERSDGTVEVTVLQGDGAGIAMRFGLAASVGGRRVNVGGEGQLGLDAGFARTFVVAGAAQAGRLIARLDAGDAPVGGAVTGLAGFLRGRSGAPGETSRTVLFSGHGEVDAGLKALGLGGDVSALRDITAGVRVERATGARTLLLRLPREAVADLSLPLVHLGGHGATRQDVELVLDRAGDPVELLVRRQAEVGGDVRLERLRAQGGDLAETQARLDLTDPVLRDLAGRLVHGDLGAARALAGQVADRARLDVRLYATTRSSSDKGVEVKALGGLGGGVTTTVATRRLVAARGREPGLGWAPRLDCLLEAGAA